MALWAVLASVAKAPGWLTAPAWNAAAGRGETRIGWCAVTAALAGCPLLLVVGPRLTGIAGAALPGWAVTAVAFGSVAATATYGLSAVAARSDRHLWPCLAVAPTLFGFLLWGLRAGGVGSAAIAYLAAAACSLALMLRGASTCLQSTAMKEGLLRVCGRDAG